MPSRQPGLNEVLERNIESLMARRRQEEARQSRQDRMADGVARFAGSMTFVWLHVALFATWVLANTTGFPGVPRFDPTLVVLAMFASVEAIFISTFVLITQNRMAEKAERRAELDLQISLLAEHEITRLIAMVGALAEHAGVARPGDAELSDLQRDVAPEQVLDRIAATEQRSS